MATFYYNRFSNESINSQWVRHLQTNAYIDDIDDIISQHRREFEQTLQDASDEQKEAIRSVCGTLENGFNEVNQHLKNINFNISELRGEINDMAAMLDWKLSLMIEGQRLTNDLLGHIKELLRIPESQKQRVYYLEQGLKYLKNAIIEGFDSAFYSDSLESFSEAEKIERKDFIVLNRIGYIHLYSKIYLNFSLAEEYFLKSAREAFAEALAGGTTTSNHFTPFGNQPLVYSENPFYAATAEAQLYAGRACYLQQKLTEASELAGKAYHLLPEFLEAGFEQAKYLAANNKQDEAVKVLETVISKDRFFTLKILEDNDLNQKSSVLSLLENLKNSALANAKAEYLECRQLIKPTSRATDIMMQVATNIMEGNFLSGMKALDLLERNYQTLYDQLPHKQSAGFAPGKLIDFIKAENFNDECGRRLSNKILRQSTISTAGLFGLLGGLLGVVVGFFKGCSFKDFSVENGTTSQTAFLFALIGVVVGALVGFINGWKNM